MKICQVLAGDEEGGLEKHTVELSQMLQRKNIEVSIIAHQKFENEFKGIRFIPLDLTKSRRNPLILYKLYRILKNENFDIIHTQANKATAMVVKLKKLLNAKIISTLHSYKKNLSPFYKSDYVITVSDKIGEKLAINNKITIYNGIKNEPIDDIDLHETYHIQPEKFIICAVGRLSYVKRFEVLIASLQHMHNVHLILVGEGKEENKLKQLVKDLNLENKVTFTGSLENSQAKAVIKSSQLFIMTSDKEGFPYTLIETLFCHTPIVSTDVSDIKSIIGEKYIIPFADDNALAEKVNKIMQNYQSTTQDFEPVYKFAKDTFTLEHMSQQNIETYKRVLS